MSDTYEYLIGAVIVLIPLTSITHFIPPLSFCLLADICNHTWIPECGEDNNDYRIFLDECDMFEYNCDYKRNFSITNYSMCFVMATACPVCPTCPPIKRQGDKDPCRRGKINLHPSGYHGSFGHSRHPHGKHGHGYSSHPYLGIFFHKDPTIAQTVFTGLKPDRTRGWRNPNRRRYSVVEGRRLLTTKKCITCKPALLSSQKRPPTKPSHAKKTQKVTKEVIRTATTPKFQQSQQTAILTIFTVIKDGKTVIKVIKGPVRQSTTIHHSNSDYLDK